MNVSRRRLLALAAGSGTALSGCLLWDTHDDSELAFHFESVAPSNLGAEFLYTNGEWTPTQRRLVASGVPNGTTAYRHEPFVDGEFVRVNGTYYSVASTENGTRTVTRPVLRAEPVSSANGERGDFSGLSPDDQRLLKCAIASADRKGPTPCVVHARTESKFWPNPPFEYLRHNDEDYRLVASERNVTFPRYDFTFESVARNRFAFAEFAARELVAVDYDARDLTEKQRSILRTAAREGAHRESPPPYSDSLLVLVRGFEASADDFRDYLRFEEAYYLAWTTRSYDD